MEGAGWEDAGEGGRDVGAGGGGDEGAKDGEARHEPVFGSRKVAPATGWAEATAATGREAANVRRSEVRERDGWGGGWVGEGWT